MPKPSYVGFDHEKFQAKLATSYDLRGEIGVLSYPFSKRVSKIWRFKDVEAATKSAKEIHDLYRTLIAKANNARSRVETRIYNFIRADICRKFLLMGYTRSMRYHYHSTGRKWVSKSSGEFEIAPNNLDPEKKKCAAIFKGHYDRVAASSAYGRALRWYHRHIMQIAFDSSRIK